MNSERILLLQLKRIGDTILTAPVVAALRQRHPRAEIVAIVPEPVADLARCFVGLDSVLPYRAWSPNLAAWVSALAGPWDACYDFTGTDRSALITAFTHARERHGYQKFARGLRARAYTHLSDASVRDLHTVDFHLALVGVQSAGDGPFLNVPPVALPAVEPPFAIVHIGTAREEKFWPAERWAEVVTSLAATHHIVLTGTNEGLERPHLDRLRALLTVPFTDLTGRLSLVQLAALTGQCDLALGVDSMAMHLAAMHGKSQVVLFGPTNPYHWRPRHAKAVVLAAGHEQPQTEFLPKAKGAPMEQLSVAQVINGAQLALARR